jgi:glycosyltransferase involved in cell wall biosynthesis
VYNGERFLRETIASLLAQDFEDFELIISDNGSTDGTRAICEELARLDPRVRYVREETNRGAAWNFNRIVPLARGEYFRWVGHDDRSDPSYLRRCVEVMDAAPESVVVVFPRTRIIDEDGHVLREVEEQLDARSPSPARRFVRIVRNEIFAHPLYGLMRIEALRRTRLNGAYPSSDYVLLGELALLGEFWEIPDYLFSRRMQARAGGKAVAMSLAGQTKASMASFFDTSGVRERHYPDFKLFKEHLNAIRLAPVSRWQKTLALESMFWLLRRRWRGVLGDIRTALPIRTGRAAG